MSGKRAAPTEAEAAPRPRRARKTVDSGTPSDAGTQTAPSAAAFDAGTQTAPSAAAFDAGTQTAPAAAAFDAGTQTAFTTDACDAGTQTAFTTAACDAGTQARPQTRDAATMANEDSMSEDIEHTDDEPDESSEEQEDVEALHARIAELTARVKTVEAQRVQLAETHGSSAAEAYRFADAMQKDVYRMRQQVKDAEAQRAAATKFADRAHRSKEALKARLADAEARLADAEARLAYAEARLDAAGLA
jgi:hypothetical protein